MKLVFAFLLLALASPAFAYDCKVNEAQVFGVVTASAPQAGACDVLLELREVANHQLCPLPVTEGMIIKLHVLRRPDGCPAIGSELSGVLQNDGPGFRLDE